jgi:hypothetical protein
MAGKKPRRWAILLNMPVVLRKDGFNYEHQDYLIAALKEIHSND